LKIHRIVQADYFNANIADPQAKTIYPHLMIIFLLLSIMKADDEIKDDNTQVIKLSPHQQVANNNGTGHCAFSHCRVWLNHDEPYCYSVTEQSL
jgi:hypothetical protein